MKLVGEDALLLASTAAGLARRGWPAARTAALLAESLPESPARTQLAAAAAALERGDAVPGSPTDALAVLLARGETAGAEALAGIAHAHALELRARRMASAALAYPATTVGVAGLMILVGGYVQRSLTGFYVGWGVSPTGFGAFALAVLPWVGIGGWILLAGGVAALAGTAFGAGFRPGVRSLRLASRLRQVDAALAGGVPAAAAFPLALPGARGFDSLGLPERERWLVERLAARSGPGAAARALADELERDAREASRIAVLLFPFVGFFALLILFALTALAVLGPILAIT